jgi:hypothetical protein
VPVSTYKYIKIVALMNKYFLFSEISDFHFVFLSSGSKNKAAGIIVKYEK